MPVAVPQERAITATSVGAVTRLPAVQADDIRTSASAYLFGDTSLVASYKAVVEKYFGNFQIIFWPFLTITVNAGSVLVIGPGQNVLSAWRIIIHHGGLVYAPAGKLKVNSTILQKA